MHSPRLILVLLCLALASPAQGQIYQWQKRIAGLGLGNPLTCNPSNENTLYAAAGAVGAVYASRDRGATWQALGAVPGGGFVKSLCVSTSDSLTMLAGQERSGVPDRVLKSTDGGSTWVETLAGEFSYYGVPLEFNPLHADTVFTMMGSTVYRSTDFGSTWTPRSTQTGFNTWCDAALRPDSGGVMYVGDNASGIWKTDDGGATFRQVYATQGEIPMIAIDGSDPSVAYATKFFGGGSGVVKTTDFGESWIELEAFQDYTQCWGIAVDRSDHRRVVMGTYTSDAERDGIYLSSDGGESWLRTTCGLGRPLSQNYGLLVLDSLTVIALQDEGAYALSEVDLGAYPRGTVAGTLSDAATGSPLRGAVRLTQSRCDSTRSFAGEADSLGEFSFDSLLVSGGVLAATYALEVDAGIPYAQRLLTDVHVDSAGSPLGIELHPADVFIVGEDSGGHESYYQDALTTLGFRHYFWNTLARGPAPLSRGAEFAKGLVIYYTAAKQTPLSQEEDQNLLDCMAAGCDVLITGQDLLERNPSAGLFTTALGIGFGGNASIVYCEGNPGGIFEGFSFFTNSSGADYPQSRDVITYAGSDVAQILGYGSLSSLGVAAVRRRSVLGGSDVVFMGFGFETINPREKRIAAMDILLRGFFGPLAVESGAGPLPSESSLRQNYPNPFNPETTIEFTLSEGSGVRLSILDLLGREVARLADGYLAPGTHRRTWDARDFAGGLYFAKLAVGGAAAHRKLILLR